jgi:hypothetical protein
MASSGMLRRMVLVRTDVWEEPSAFFIRVTRIGELETTLAVTSNRRSLRRLLLNIGLVMALNTQETRKMVCSMECTAEAVTQVCEEP